MNSYRITNADGAKLGTITAPNATEALNAYCADHPDADTGYQRGGLMIDADTRGDEWAIVKTDAGKLTATRITDRSYAIAIIGNYYQPDIQRNGDPKFMNDPCSGEPAIIFDTLEAAQDALAEIEDNPYTLAHGEAGRPEMFVVDADAVYEIQANREDLGRYDWPEDCEGWECCDEHGNVCGACDQCFDLMAEQDEATMREHAVEAVDAVDDAGSQRNATEGNHSGMTKAEFAEWLHGLHTEDIQEKNTPEGLLRSYWAECENHDHGLCLCEVRARHGESGNPVSFDFPDVWFDEPGTTIRYVVDAAMLGSLWRGGDDDLQTFAQYLQSELGEGWEVVAITDSYNGASNRDPETGDMIEIPEAAWLRALDRHAVEHPECWNCM